MPTMSLTTRTALGLLRITVSKMRTIARQYFLTAFLTLISKLLHQPHHISLIAPSMMRQLDLTYLPASCDAHLLIDSKGHG